MSRSKFEIAEEFRALQQYICTELERIDGGTRFGEDNWSREDGGGGRTKTLANGNVIEKGGVAFSEVFGDVSPEMKKQLSLEGNSFFATGVSIVLHPNNPHVPIIHMNVRYFELDNGTYWFGGGIDLTPHYIQKEQASLFHRGLKDFCDAYNKTLYPVFKNQADDYFFIPHRNETRGVGGIFYDHVTASIGLDREMLIDFSVNLGKLFPVLYEQQVVAGKDSVVEPQELRWRNLRRGRYVEFNLVNDRGTKFGLFSGGRTESILMSLPPDASWEYMSPIERGSKEEQTQQLLKKAIDWAEG